MSTFVFHPAHNHWHVDKVALFEIRAALDDGTGGHWGGVVGGQSIKKYHQATEGQELEITGAPAGRYYLASTANPDGNFLETTTSNNSAWTSFRITRDSQGNAKVSEIAHSPCSGSLCGVDIPNR